MLGALFADAECCACICSIVALLGAAERFALAAARCGDHVCKLDTALHARGFESHLAHVRTSSVIQGCDEGASV